MILGEQNAGNIEFLKQQIGDIPALKTTLDSLLKRMDQLEEQMNNLTIQQNKAFQDLSGGSPPPPTTGLD
jgi:prefoldin subunit 5